MALILIPLLLQALPARAAGTTTLRLLTTGSSNSRLGLEIFANANLMGTSSAPTGTITFKAFGPNDATCSTAAFTSTVAVSGTSANSARFTPAHAGLYRWTSTYSGDATYAVAGPTSCTDAAADVIVGQAATFVSAVAAAPTPTSIHGTASLSNGIRPTGTLRFVLTGPNDIFCSGTPAFTSTVAISGNGSYDSGAFTPTRSGKYTWMASYSGDTDNQGSTITPCLNAAASQTFTVAPTSMRLKMPYSVWNQPAGAGPDSIGIWIATVNDPTAAAGQVAPQYLYAHTVGFVNSPAKATVGLTVGPGGKSAVFGATGPDGTPYNASVAYNWSGSRYYFPFVYASAPGVWTAMVYDYAANTWTTIGSLNLPTSWGKLSSVSSTSVVWLGASARECSAYPRADVYFSPSVGYGAAITYGVMGTNTTIAGDCPTDGSPAGTWIRYRLGT